MRSFETQGLIRRRQGSGTFVVGKMQVLDSGMEVLESLETMAKRLGLKFLSVILSIEPLLLMKSSQSYWMFCWRGIDSCAPCDARR
jgi:DNA-binding GntR family transcriptional regulator